MLFGHKTEESISELYGQGYYFARTKISCAFVVLGACHHNPVLLQMFLLHLSCSDILHLHSCFTKDRK